MVVTNEVLNVYSLIGLLSSYNICPSELGFKLFAAMFILLHPYSLQEMKVKVPDCGGCYIFLVGLIKFAVSDFENSTV